MARTPRSHLPGAVFHLTARTQGREPWFTGVLRSRIVQYTASAIGVSDARLIAYAIMPNHLHLVIQQGEWSLGRVMQPLMRRIAGLVQRSHGIAGHVFERRFSDSACLDPDYARNAIIYTHLNPVRARLVERPAAYAWSSQRAYEGDLGTPTSMAKVLDVEAALELFAPRQGLELDELRRAYNRYLGWRVRCDRHRVAERRGQTVCTPPPPPPVWSGDRCWSRSFAPGFCQPSQRADDAGLPRPARPDLHDIARQIVARYEPAPDLDRVRSRDKSRGVVRVRREIAQRLSNVGYRGQTIAHYLRVTPQCVSKILAEHRNAAGRSTR
jgi:REP element-mobilizing transposase RayT